MAHLCVLVEVGVGVLLHAAHACGLLTKLALWVSEHASRRDCLSTAAASSSQGQELLLGLQQAKWGAQGTLCEVRTPELLRTPCSAGEGELKPAKLRCRGCMTRAQLHCAAGRRASMLQLWGDTAPGPVLPAKRLLASAHSYADDTDVSSSNWSPCCTRSRATRHCSGAKQPILRTLSVCPA